MELTINGTIVVLSDTGRISKGGNEIHEVKGAALSDGTKLYLTAYRPNAEAKAKVAEKKSIAPSVRKAAATSAPPAVDMAKMIAEAVAVAIAGLKKA